MSNSFNISCSSKQFLKSLHEEFTEGEDEICSLPTVTWHYAELISRLFLTSRSGCSKNFKELDEEMCGLLKLVNHGNARKACLEKKKIQILVIIDISD